MSEKALNMPRKVTIALTGRCNLTCKYCFYANEMVALSDIPTETWLAFFEELRDVGVMSVSLSGGEVFTHRDLWTLIDGVVKNKMRFSILTNGTLITDEVAARLAEYRRRLDIIQVSLDGSKPETHNAIRGKKAFERTMRGIRAIKKYDLPWTVRFTLNKLNVYDLEDTLSLLYDDLELRNLGVNEAFPRGAGACNHSTLDMTPEERRMAFRIMQDFDAKHPGAASGSQAGPLITAKLLDIVDHAQVNGEVKMPFPTGTLSGCRIFWNQIDVLHDGTLVPCHQLSHIKLGKVGQDSLRDVWLNSPELNALRDRINIPLSSLPFCQGCTYQNLCTGGCPGIAYALTGDVNTPNPMACYRAYKGEHPVHVY
jgi:SynChlorMet cassette radical SAM/SPASM protein ScmE